MTDEEIKQYQIRISANPESTDISSLPPSEYKYLDRYRSLMCEYKYGEKTKEECQAEGKLLRKEYERDREREAAVHEIYLTHQEYVKQSSDLCAEITKDDYPIQETLVIALRIISNMRCESVTERTVLRRLGIE